MVNTPKNDETYSEAETVRRRDAIVRNMIATPPTPHKKATEKRKVSLRVKKKLRSS
jgi:hypothetical protein